MKITLHPPVHHVSSDKSMPRYLQCPSTFDFFVLCPPKEEPTTESLMEDTIFNLQLNLNKLRRSECYD